MEFMKNKLLGNKDLKDLLSFAKEKSIQLWVSGGAITCLATGRHDEIEDYDIYFKDKYACVEMIRYMKELDPHISFISDKSITYVFKDSTKVQFIFYDFYNTAKDIFNHFDFNCCMGAYNSLTGGFEYDSLFWLHNGQRYLGINGDTRFPILTMLRLDKYKSRGYKTSRNEIIKLGLKISQLNIDSWDKFKEHIGNSYGFTLADLHDCEKEEFSIDKAITKLLDSNSEPVNQECYAYPYNAVDFVVLNEPLEYVTMNDVDYYTDSYANDAEDNLNDLVDQGVLSKVKVSNEYLLNKQYYACIKESYVNPDTLEITGKPSYEKLYLYTLDNLKLEHWARNHHIIVKVKNVDEKDVLYVGDYLQVDGIIIDKIMCRAGDKYKLQKGEEVCYKPKVKVMNKTGNHSDSGHAFRENGEFIRGKIAQVKEDKLETLKQCIIMSKSPCYGHTKFSGNVLEGGENLSPYEILLFADDFNLCFGGDITVNSDGTFNGRYNVD